MGGQFTSYIPSINPSSSMMIPMNYFMMLNPPLSSGVLSRGSHLYGMGNPQHGVPLSRVNLYNNYHVSSMGMVPLKLFMNHLGGG
jgi:hypothetical protein